MTQLRTAAKHILYAVSRSLAMNGISSSAEVVHTLPLWQIWLIIADIVLGILAVGGAVLIVLKTKWKKEN